MLDAAGALGLSNRIEWTNGRRTVCEVLAESDVLVSVSAHEGLSLAHLEALAAGVPVVATDVGGAAELAHANPAVSLVAHNATAQTFADTILNATGSGGADAVRRDFSRERMAARYVWLYRAAVHGPARGDTLWFVANNLCTGGAQSSLRRLVKTLHAQGVPVRVAVLQEYAEHPTPGRDDLLSGGVPVTVLPPAGTLDPADAVEMLLAEMRERPPRAVTFWNAIQSYKLLIADALLRVPVFDVSPGEMFFDSLDAYFARPRGGLPYRSPRDYGERLAGVIVKYAGEAQLARERLGTPVHVIPNGVPLRPVLSRRSAGHPLVIGTAARLHPHKRIEDLLDAFHLALPRLPADTVLRIAGEADHACDEYVATLRGQSRDLPVDWVGNVSDVAAFHDSLDIFAMISEPAGCPTASLEAMAAGLPVVATDVGGAAEQVVDRVTGRVVPPRDAPAFADALVGLGNCPECRARRGAAGRERIATHFSTERMAADYRTLLLS
jgi:glycosyltransferase involved in cell wall biosynthesis